MINEPYEPLIFTVLSADPRTFADIFTVKVRGTSIGAGLQAIRQNVTFRGLSTPVDPITAARPISARP
jgi:hypothetical protein